MKKYLLMSMVALSAFGAHAQERVVDNDRTSSLEVSIYNNNLALVNDVRQVALEQGDNLIAFEGVAREIRPETVQIKAPGVIVLEQNYEYNVLSYANMLNETIGQQVKTAVLNPETGQTIFDKAKLINAEYGQPILAFDYGVEANFPGRVVFEKIPNNLRQKPTMIANIRAEKNSTEKMEMMYLTQGMSWKADYVADIKSDERLDLSAWITLNNNSGVDYKNATVNVISGAVNQEAGYYSAQNDMVMMEAAVMPRAMKASGAVGMAQQVMPVSEGIGDYYLYALPLKTTIKDKQSKQVSLFAKDNVKYDKFYKIQSPLYIGYSARAKEMKNIKPQIIVKLHNVAEDNLGLPIPQGIVRFYDKDSKGNAQFMGESRVEQLALGGEAELRLGSSFDLFANAKLQNIVRLSEDIVEVEVEIEINNASDKPSKVEYLQNFANQWTIISETVKSVQQDANTAKWSVEIPAKGKVMIGFKVRINKK